MAPRMNIYLPSDLAAEVRSADLNVSQVAQEALREELHRRELTGDPNEVVARLRETIGEEDRRQRAAYYEHGKRWAQTQATVAELEGLESLVESDWEHWGIPPSHSLHAYMRENVLPNWRKVRRIDRGPTFDAFIEGALAVWDQVRNDVYGRV